MTVEPSCCITLEAQIRDIFCYWWWVRLFGYDCILGLLFLELTFPCVSDTLKLPEQLKYFDQIILASTVDISSESIVRWWLQIIFFNILLSHMCINCHCSVMKRFFFYLLIVDSRIPFHLKWYNITVVFLFGALIFPKFFHWEILQPGCILSGFFCKNYYWAKIHIACSSPFSGVQFSDLEYIHNIVQPSPLSRSRTLS